MSRDKWDDSNDKFWYESGKKSFNLDDNLKPVKYNFDEISKFSARTKAAPAVSSQNESLQMKVNAEESLTYSKKLNDISFMPELKCSACNNIINEGDIRYEKEKVFHNDLCWRHWIDRICQGPNYNIKDLQTNAAKKYFLEKICSTSNGRVITKVIVDFKNTIDPYQFGALMFENNIAYKHYIAYLKETNQTDESLLRSKDPLDSVINKLQSIILENIGNSSNENLIISLSEFSEIMEGMKNKERERIKKDHLQVTYNMAFQCELISEYIILLDLQEKMNSDKVSLITNLADGIAYDAFQKNKLDILKKMRMSPDEFFWLCIKPMVRGGKIEDVEKLMNFKGLGSKTTIEMNRVVAYLVYLEANVSEDDIPKATIIHSQMVCLSKIPNITDLENCARLYKLTNRYIEFLKRNNDKKQLKKLEEVLNSRR